MNDDYWENDLKLIKTIFISPGEVRHGCVVPVLTVPGPPPVLRVTAVRILGEPIIILGHFAIKITSNILFDPVRRDPRG